MEPRTYRVTRIHEQKERKLKILVQNYSYFETEVYFKALDNIYKWSFD
jgi:hypothetical protein